MVSSRRLVIGGVAAVVLVLIPAWRADADDRKNYPATLCVQQGVVSGSGDTRIVQYDGAGRVINPSRFSTVRLVCPIVRDETGRKWHRVTVRVVDRSDGEGIICFMGSIGPNGAFTAFSRAQNTTGASGTVQSLDLNADPGAVGFLDTYVMQCTLPRDTGNGPSSILSYSVAEPDG